MILSIVAAATALHPPSQLVSRSAVLRSTAAAAAAATTAAANAVPPPDILAKAPLAPPGLQAQVEPMVLYTPPSVKGQSTPEQIALAEHLEKTGAKFYGAYWCSFCNRQRNMFGAGGTRKLPYVECASDGFNSQKCPPQVTGYPAWEIGGKFYGGFRTLQDLQTLSAFDPTVKFPEYVPPAPPPRPPPPPGGYKPPPVQEKSTTEQLALAKHLRQTGAEFYGAYWCKYCGLQRTMFGAEASAVLPYVECAADGFQNENQKCRTKTEVEGYPTWQIGGKYYGGYQSAEDLARLSGFNAKGSQPAAVVASTSTTTPAAKPNSLGIDFGNGSAPRVQVGDDCDLQNPEDCK